jgi:hypothetical protein
MGQVYPKINPQDIKYTKFVKKRVSKNEAENKYLFFPGIDKRFDNFFEFLIHYLNKPIVFMDKYGAVPGSEFSTVQTIKDIEEKLGIREADSLKIKKSSIEITSYLMIELHYYNFRNKLLLNQILGLCPVREYSDSKAKTCYQEIGWIFYHELINVLVDPSFYQKCPGQQLSFHDLFSKRMLKTEDVNIYGEYRHAPGESNAKKEMESFVDASYYSFFINKGHWNSLMEAKNLKWTKNIEYAKIIYSKLENKGKNKVLFIPDEEQLGYMNFFKFIESSFSSSDVNVYQDVDFEDQLNRGEPEDYFYEPEKILLQYMLSPYGLLLDQPKVEYPEDSKIIGYYLKELWLFNKRHKPAIKLVLGFCPISERNKEKDLLQIKSVWVKFSDLSKRMTYFNVTKQTEIEDISLYDYFIDNKYSSEAHLEKEININDAKEMFKSIFDE